MTETYDRYANAIAERINGILKQEFIGENRNLEINSFVLSIEPSSKIINSQFSKV
jgi:putative transposase